MAESLTSLEQLRQRLLQRIASFRLGILGESNKRVLLRGENNSGGVVGQIQIGQGVLIDQVTKRVDTLLATIKEKRPQIIPTVVEKIRTFEPGKRVTELVAPPSGAQAPTTPTAPTKKFLRG